MVIFFVHRFLRQTRSSRRLPHSRPGIRSSFCRTCRSRLSAPCADGDGKICRSRPVVVGQRSGKKVRPGLVGIFPRIAGWRLTASAAGTRL